MVAKVFLQGQNNQMQDLKQIVDNIDYTIFAKITYSNFRKIMWNLKH